MIVKNLPKNKHKSVRINEDVLEKLGEMGFTLQSFLDECLDEYLILKLDEKKMELNKS